MEANVVPFLKQKWIQAYHFFDHNKDGKINKEDMAEMADYISAKTGATSEEAAKLRQEWMKWMDTLGVSSLESIDDYLEACSNLCQDKDHHKQVNMAMANELFHILDLDKDGKISVGELAIFYGSVGLEDESVVAEAFGRLDKDGDGFIRREELAEDMIRHFTNPDPIEGRAFFISSVMEKMGY